MIFLEKGRVLWFQSLFREFTLSYKIRIRLLGQVYHFSLLICYPYSLPLSRAVNLNMSLFKHKTSPIDPSKFFWAFRNKIPKIVNCLSILIVNKMFLKVYKLWLMSWKVYLSWQTVSFHPLSKHQSLATFAFAVTSRKKNLI